MLSNIRPLLLAYGHRRHIQRQSDENWATSGMKYFSLRYVFVPSLLASVVVVPKLISFYSVSGGGLG